MTYFGDQNLILSLIAHSERIEIIIFTSKTNLAEFQNKKKIFLLMLQKKKKSFSKVFYE